MAYLPETSYRKATQALNFLAEKKDGKINKMKALKLIYLADRLHLRKYGRPIIGDMYWAMKLGPVGSQTKRIAELDLSGDILSYAKKYIKTGDQKKRYFISLQPTDMDVFSKTDVTCLEIVYNNFKDKDQFELAELTHTYPEWKKHEKELRTGKKRIAMDYYDFFAETDTDDSLFGQKKAELALAKNSFEESEEVSAFFAR